MKIIEIDTTDMDPIFATYWNNLKIEIMKKTGFYFLVIIYYVAIIHEKLCIKFDCYESTCGIEKQLEIEIKKITLCHVVPRNA